MSTTQPAKPVCQQCGGKGYHEQSMRQSRSTPYRFALNHGCDVVQTVVCNLCDNGVPNHGRYLCGIGGPAWERFRREHPTEAARLVNSVA